jgi:hypothetical protein
MAQMRIRIRANIAAALLSACVPSLMAEDRPAAPAGSRSPITFSRHIAPVIYRNCATCHRPGEVAPFELLSYTDVKKRAKLIKEVTARRYMPPWKSVEGHGDFVDARRLTAAETELIAQWIEQGAIEGDPRDLPPLPAFRDGWKLGQPDIVVSMPEAYEIPADGPDIYRNFVLELRIPSGKYIKAAEYRPGNRRVVHHAALSFDVTGKFRQQDAADPQPGFKGNLNIPGQLFPGSLSAWTPGRDPMPLPEGFSMPWKPGADLILQLHLHPVGKPEVERSTIGIYLTDQPPRKSMVDVLLIDKKIDIPAGEAAFRTRDELVLPVEMEAFGIFPHMHLIGRDMKVTAHPPQGDPFSLIWISDWDFNWQNFYQFATPVKLAAGTRIVMEAVHDNSAENVRNPSQPPKRVVWGEQTADEMSAAFLQLVPVLESDLPQMARMHRRRIIGGIAAKPAAPAQPEAAPRQPSL